MHALSSCDAPRAVPEPSQRGTVSSVCQVTPAGWQDPEFPSRMSLCSEMIDVVHFGCQFEYCG